tara:strand:- start:2799 stop:3107 length:309 start_codon:yes stop_codon:yes gene_type:complete
MRPTINDALFALGCDGGWKVKNGVISGWTCKTPQPNDEAIEAKLKELQADYDSKSYARAREAQYPSITDVVVALAEKQEGDDTMWKEITALRQKVKSDNPKP